MGPDAGKLIHWYHLGMFTPVILTWITAIQRGWFNLWPGLTAAAVKKHLKPLEATIMGHMNKRRQGIQSTRNEIKTPYPVTDIDKGSDKGQRTNLVFVKKIIVNEATGVLYANLQGPLSVLSGQGNGYIWIFYAYDCNAVMTIQ